MSRQPVAAAECDLVSSASAAGPPRRRQPGRRLPQKVTIRQAAASAPLAQIADSARANEDLSATVDPLITTSSVRTVRSPERTIRTVAQLPHTDTRGPASVTLRPGPATGTPGGHQNPLPLAAITNCPRASPIIRCGSPAGRTRSTGTCHTIASRWCRSARCGGPIMSTPQVAAPRLAGTARAPAGSQLVLAE